MLTYDDVVVAYQLILGRKPESDKMVLQHIAEARNFENLRNVLLTSDEFVQRARSDPSLRKALYPALSAMVPVRMSD